jgi:hypothetical protein
VEVGGMVNETGWGRDIEIFESSEGKVVEISKTQI